jgi:hypothetical protein
MEESTRPEDLRSLAIEVRDSDASDALESLQLETLIIEQSNNLDRLAGRIEILTQRELESRSLLEIAREQLAARDAALQSLQDTLRQIERERDQLRSMVSEAIDEIESREITIDKLRGKLKKRKR